MRTMEEIIISRGDIEKIYRSQITLTLWRGLNKADSRRNPLYPDMHARMINGEIREADVRVYQDRAGVDTVQSEEGRGTSVVDKEGIFGFGKWEYVSIPPNTVIPKELIITKDYFFKRKNCWHYSISPNYDMPVSNFLAALDQLAINAKITIAIQKHA